MLIKYRNSVAYFDIGGTYVRTEVVKNGRILFYKKVHTAADLTKFIKQLQNIVNKLVKKYHSRQIIFGVAGVVAGSAVKYCPNIKYLRNFDFKKMLPPPVKVLVDNDARLWLRRLVELEPQLGKGVVLGITLGTGIGRAVVRNGRVLAIKKFEYPEKWEPEYQQRRFAPGRRLAALVVKNLQSIINYYKPTWIVFGGGVIEKKLGFYQELVSIISRHKPRIKAASRP